VINVAFVAFVALLWFINLNKNDMETKMKTLYRADDYTNNMGMLKGFYSSIEEAEANIEYSEACSYQTESGSFSQITEFTLPANVLEGVNIKDTKRMIEEDIWGAGEIIKDYYYV